VSAHAATEPPIRATGSPWSEPGFFTRTMNAAAASEAAKSAACRPARARAAAAPPSARSAPRQANGSEIAISFALSARR
jgi:hypothetical protein